MAEDIVLSTNVGTGDTLRADETATGEKVQYVKLMDPTSASETLVGFGPGTEATCLRVTLPTDGTGVVILGAGTAAIGTVILGTGTASVGTVGLNAGTNKIGTIEGDVAHDAAGTGIQPLLDGHIAYAQDGTAPGTAVAEGDLTRSKSDLDGRQYVNTAHPALASKIIESSAAQTATELVAQPAAGFSVYITDIQMSAITAQTAWLHDEDDTVVFPLQYFGANTGIVSANLKTPIKLTAVKALELTSTAAIAHSCFISYYIAP